MRRGRQCGGGRHQRAIVEQARDHGGDPLAVEDQGIEAGEDQRIVRRSRRILLFGKLDHGDAPQWLARIVALVGVAIAQLFSLALRRFVIKGAQIVAIQMQRHLWAYVLSGALHIDAGAQRRVVLYQLGQARFKARYIPLPGAVFAKVVHRHAAERPSIAATQKVGLLQCG